jgi:hypothetical protein
MRAKLKKWTRLYLSVLMTLAFCSVIFVLNSQTAGTEPDEKRSLTEIKNELKKKGELLGKVLDRFNFGILIEAGAVFRDENADGEDESDISLTTVEVGDKRQSFFCQIAIEF